MATLLKRVDIPKPLNVRLIAYWILTLVIAWENIGGAIWAFLRIDYSRVTLTHLGYPLFVFNILGPGELLIGLALVLPGFPIAKEWAFAGTIAKYAAALTSWISLGEIHEQANYAILCLALAIAAWALRPRDRVAPRVTEVPASRWIGIVALLAVFAVITLVTLPAPPVFPT